MKKLLAVALVLLIVLSLIACGDTPSTSQLHAGNQQDNTQQTGSDKTEPQVVDVSDWTGSYKTTQADEEVSIEISSSEYCQITYHGKTVTAKAIAIHDIGDGALELQMLEDDSLLHHLVYFPTNPSNKRLTIV